MAHRCSQDTIFEGAATHTLTHRRCGFDPWNDCSRHKPAPATAARRARQLTRSILQRLHAAGAERAPKLYVFWQDLEEGRRMHVGVKTEVGPGAAE